MAEPNFKDLPGRLRWALAEAGLSAPELEERSGVNLNTIRSHLKGRALKEDRARRLARHLKIDWAWLMTGAGSPRGKPDADTFDPSGLIVGAQLAAINEIDLYAGAGGGGEIYQEQSDGSFLPAGVKAQALFPHAWLALFGLDPATTDLVRVRGDSMSPEIEDGDWVFVDRRVHRLAADDIYLLWDGFGVVAKSLAIVRASSPEAPRVRILSANPKYPPDEVPADQVKIIGRVQYRIGRIVRR